MENPIQAQRPVISVIIPVYREGAAILGLLDHLSGLDGADAIEIVVADGWTPTAPDSDPDNTLDHARVNARDSDTLAAIPPGAARGLRTARGRASQMNAGAAAAQGDILLFLHADTRLPDNAFGLIRAVLADPTLGGGAFGLDIAPAGPLLRIIARLADLRSRLTSVPYGDQAIFLRRAVFVRQGGFADIPLMEDLELMTRLRRSGVRIRIARERVRTSSRRWTREGVLRCTLRNLLLRLAYHLGVPPERLTRFYC